jgi:uncharacterized protein (DUF433 family)
VSLTLEPETVPLSRTPDGVIRVGGTRVPLDTVVYAFRDGATAETIVDRYPTLTLADVYATIAYYLRHPAETDAYLAEQERKSAEVRAENEHRFPPEGVRARLLARRTAG